MDKIKDWPAGLHEFRKRHGLTQKVMAKLLNDTRPRTYEDWEAGKSKPPAILQLALAHIDKELTRRKAKKQ